jgi:hypothetical protein
MKSLNLKKVVRILKDGNHRLNKLGNMTVTERNKKCVNLSHKHDIMKTHVSFIEFDDVMFTKLAKDIKYFGEGNCKERVLEFNFEYCLNCNLRLLDGKPIMTRDILEEEFERLVTQAKNNKYVNSEQTTLQHTDFETFERLINSALSLGKLKENKV